MPRRSLIVLLPALLVLGSARRVNAQDCQAPPRPLALVLSGGGAKGLAHIGVLEVLDSLGIRPDLIVGTSMGAMVGAMYASGQTPAQIMAQASGLALDKLLGTTEPRVPHAIGDHRPIVVWEPGVSGLRGSGLDAREAAINSMLSASLLRGNLAARGDFDSLSIPFRAVATDLRTREEVVLGRGDLARAVRASMGVPLLLDPLRLEGRDLVDGGLVANVPVAAARMAGALRVIISDVSWQPPDSIRASDPLVVADLLVGHLFRQPLESLDAADRIIRPAVDSFQNLDFDFEKLPRIIEEGRRAARESFAAIPSCDPPGPRPPRASHAYHIASLSVEEGDEKDRQFLEAFLGLELGQALEPADLHQRLASLAYSDDYLAVWLQPSGPPDSLSFSLAVRRLPSRLAVAALAYDNDLGGQVWAGAVDRGRLIHGLEMSATLVFGELRQQAALGLHTGAVGRNPRAVVLTGDASREDVRQFDSEGALLPSIRTRELSGMLGLEQRLGYERIGHEWRATIGGFGSTWDSAGVPRSALGGILRLSSGPAYRESGVWAGVSVSTEYSRASVVMRRQLKLGHFKVTPGLRYGWGEDLPPQHTFMLGGIDGFPGYAIGELRGDREAFAELVVSRQIYGPLSLRARGTTGQVANGGSMIPAGSWEVGGSAGARVETPIGPIQAEYGYASDGRGRFFVRVGEWF